MVGNKMNIPPITSIDNALQIYYNHSELGNKEIKHLFGKRSSATIARLKKIVKADMIKCDISSFGRDKINTAMAFDIWGIDVKDLEKRRNKIKELKL